MEPKKKKKEKTYICQICGKKEKSTQEKNCCSKKMTQENKGTWNA